MTRISLAFTQKQPLVLGRWGIRNATKNTSPLTITNGHLISRSWPFIQYPLLGVIKRWCRFTVLDCQCSRTVGSTLQRGCDQTTSFPFSSSPFWTWIHFSSVVYTSPNIPPYLTMWTKLNIKKRRFTFFFDVFTAFVFMHGCLSSLTSSLW